MVYSAKDIKEAKDYLKTRLSAEQSMATNLEEALYVAAGQLIQLCKRFNVEPKDIATTKNAKFNKALLELIAKLEDDLYYMVETLAAHADEKDKEYILWYMNRNIYGQNLKGRIAKHVGTFMRYAAGIIAVSGKFERGVLNKSILSFGAGHSLNILLRDTIARVYMEEWKKMHEGYSGFYAFRGSSYPCATCDDYTGYHPAEEYALPLHPNCCCYAVWVNKK